MVEYIDIADPRLDHIFHALADPTRRAMLHSLSERERSVGELAEPFAMSLAGASKHIKALEAAGLVRRDIRGRQHLCRLEPARLAAAHEWLGFYERFWTDRLGTLDALLRAEDAGKATPDAPHGAPYGEDR
ncbi:ArsR/SmtB family transcription factor [Ancylobacter radicis]|uniref:Winged helix-turn-helix transcriptional regulator n=1 Tax=Ancylobacter radicis TaxID=2836179 RepID=A0ABS5R263_9HYPH|nr:metalloregulator ArsR/SmtB family transcription factor [Ancylobacter radicis]MBS9475582.1 winged helix-turn-helix transcriptional regulator [Ancylobacter radicis]